MAQAARNVVRLAVDAFEHPKLLALASDSARWRWVRCIGYAVKFETKGYVPTSVAGDHADELLGAGLFEVREGELWLHDFTHWQAIGEAIKAPEVEPDGFVAWWDAYPRKIARKAALTAYRNALEVVKDPAVLFEGLNRSKAAWAAEGRSTTKLPHATTWLHQHRWEDIYDGQQLELGPASKHLARHGLLVVEDDE